MRSKVTYQGQGSSKVKLGGKYWFSLFGSPSFEKLKSDWNQLTWVKDVLGVSLYVNEVNGHVPRPRVI